MNPGDEDSNGSNAMSVHEPQPGLEQPPQKRLLLKLGIGCLSLFLLVHLVMTAVDKIQDMTDRAH